MKPAKLQGRASARLAPINRENGRASMRSPDLIRDAAARGRTNPKFSELAGLRIDLYRPLCCLTMMS